MRGEHRFLRTKSGVSYFARVEVEIVTGETNSEVEDALPDNVDTNAGEVNSRVQPSWVQAALEGIRAAMDRTGQNGSAHGHYHASLIRLQGTISDTREDVIRCAAGLAAWKALGSEGPAPETAFDGKHWVLEYRTPVLGPAERSAT